MLSAFKTFIFLSAILNSTLYISKPQNAIDCYITLDYDEKLDDSWPDRWTSMQVKSSDCCEIDVKKNWSGVLINHKIRYIYPNRSHWLYDEGWSGTLYSQENLKTLTKSYKYFTYVFIIFVYIMVVILLLEIVYLI